MQDAIYNQIQLATNVANTPYQPYSMPTVAELSPLQQQAYQQVQQNVGAWRGDLSAAQGALTAAGGVSTLGAPSQYFNQASAIDPSKTAAPFLSQAGALDIPGAAQPFLSQASSINAGQAAQPFLSQASGISGLEAAQPYMNQAAQKSVTDIGSYMNPYQQNVMDVIARQGARNLSENLLPKVSDSFIKAGQFGSTRMGEFGNRAVRDTQEAILNQQAQLANQGYAQGLQVSQADLQRQAALGQSAGSLEAQRQAALANIGQTTGSLEAQRQSALANIGQTTGGLTAQQANVLANLGQTAGGLDAQKMQALTTMGSTMGQLASADASRQLQAAGQMSALAQMGQSMRTADVAALESAGMSQQNQMQRQLDAARQQYEAQQLYPRQQLDWLSTQVRGMAPITPTSTSQFGQTTGATYSPSPLSQLATGMYTYKGLQGL
jgi:hypothetical protein